MATTRTYTTTTARLVVIMNQFEYALELSAGLSSTSQERVLFGIEQKWIQRVLIYAINGENLCQGLLELEVDWDEYELQIGRGKLTIPVEGVGWIDGTALEIRTLVKYFNRWINEKSLRPDCRVMYHPSLDVDEINRRLGFRNGSHINWKPGIRTSDYMGVEGLDEVRAGIVVVD